MIKHTRTKFSSLETSTTLRRIFSPLSISTFRIARRLGKQRLHLNHRTKQMCFKSPDHVGLPSYRQPIKCRHISITPELRQANCCRHPTPLELCSLTRRTIVELNPGVSWRRLPGAESRYDLFATNQARKHATHVISQVHSLQRALEI